MRFLLVPSAIDPSKPSHAEAPFDEKLFAAYMRFNEEMHKAGVLVASEGLLPGNSGAHVTTVAGRRTVRDGPFAESKELVAGFWLIEVPSKKDAIEWALRAPIAPDDEVIEIRQLTAASDLPKELVDLTASVAPAWAASWRTQQGS